ncbi:hypothetical protein CLF_101118 [Clonorchis sinensis]|uniref:Uncharacterized protein n=1 Tax=Clonorchis sinensis TaxID=79923 RepID=G7Y513_CLOSI|nr:hypothetical protein CLF_101118 [Clonorchis sinensis]
MEENFWIPSHLKKRCLVRVNHTTDQSPIAERYIFQLVAGIYFQLGISMLRQIPYGNKAIFGGARHGRYYSNFLQLRDEEEIRNNCIDSSLHFPKDANLHIRISRDFTKEALLDLKPVRMTTHLTNEETFVIPDQPSTKMFDMLRFRRYTLAPPPGCGSRHTLPHLSMSTLFNATMRGKTSFIENRLLSIKRLFAGDHTSRRRKTSSNCVFYVTRLTAKYTAVKHQFPRCCCFPDDDDGCRRTLFCAAALHWYSKVVWISASQSETVMLRCILSGRIKTRSRPRGSDKGFLSPVTDRITDKFESYHGRELLGRITWLYMMSPRKVKPVVRCLRVFSNLGCELRHLGLAYGQSSNEIECRAVWQLYAGNFSGNSHTPCAFPVSVDGSNLQTADPVIFAVCAPNDVTQAQGTRLESELLDIRLRFSVSSITHCDLSILEWTCHVQTSLTRIRDIQKSVRYNRPPLVLLYCTDKSLQFALSVRPYVRSSNCGMARADELK